MSADVTVRPMRRADAEPVLRLWHRSWLDTYAVPGSGVTADWVDERWDQKLTPQGIESLAERIAAGPGPHQGRFYLAESGARIVGLAAPFVEPGRGQRVGALYVDRPFLGQSVGAALMREILAGFDLAQPVHLQVASFNQRAITFYERFGFRKVPGSDQLYDGVITEFWMRRDPDLTASPGVPAPV